MSDASAVPPAANRDLPTADETIELVRRWLDRSNEVPLDKGTRRLAALVHDPRGVEFALGFVDRVVRPADPRVAARSLERLSRTVPSFLPWYLRAAVVLGGGFALLFPRPVIGIARRLFRRLVRHLVLDAAPARLGTAIASLRRPGIRLNLNLVGEAVLGEREGARRLAGIRELVARDDVDHVSIKVSSIASRLTMWGFEATVDRVVERLTPLYEQAAAAKSRKLLTLDMEEYRDLDLTIAVFTRLMSRPELRGLEAGIVLQAYLPDGLAALQELGAWARQRVAGGGAGIKVRIAKGANLSMERVDAEMHGWPLATWATKHETDTNFKRMLDWALTPARTDAMRIGIASHNLFDLAFAWQLAGLRGVASRVEIEMLLGMAPAHAEVVRAETGAVLLYTPVVHRDDFPAAVGYLVRRLEENSNEGDFLAVLDRLDEDTVFAAEARRFAASLEALDRAVPSPHRVQDRLHPPVPRAPARFENEPDTDPAIAANRAWARTILDRARSSQLGLATLEAERIPDEEALRERIRRAAVAGTAWGRVPVGSRAELLGRAGEVLAVLRGRLIEVMVAETGATIAEADTEVSAAIDAAQHSAARARELDGVAGARFQPAALTVAASPSHPPVSVAAAGVLGAIGAGSAALLVPAPGARRCAAVIAEAFWEAGVPRDVLGLVDLPLSTDGGDLRRALVTAPEVDRVLLTGSSETAALWRSWRPGLPLLGQTGGRNAIVVTPSADLDLAVADLVQSAFDGAGQGRAAVSLAILVGALADSEVFRSRLVDEVTSLAVGSPFESATWMGPLLAPLGERAGELTRLGDGESWLVAPRQLDASDRLWSPGVRDGVRPGSEAHLAGFPGPVLGLMPAATLDEAIELQNASEHGLAAGLHALDPREIVRWLDTVEAGNLFVNRPVTGGIVGRQPFGGWNRSAVGPGAKSGGPNSLHVLGTWQPLEIPQDGDLRLDGLDDRVRALIEACQSGLDYAGFDDVRRGALSDEDAWTTEFGRSHDPAALGVERNVFRYRPAKVTIRLAEGASGSEFVRVLAAGIRARAELRLSSAAPLPSGLLPLASDGLLLIRAIVVESDEAWRDRMARELPARIRLVGGDDAGAALAGALDGSLAVTVWSGPVTSAGRIEMLPFLCEQSISITAHRFGSPDRDIRALDI